jgi:metal-responsive CopG/Arc/MetJ family transcriptional regulator
METRTKIKVVQVPMSKTLADSLDEVSRDREQSRAALIRELCERFLKQLEEARLDREYAEGYRRMPETDEDDEWRMKLLEEVWGEEDWEGW